MDKMDCEKCGDKMNKVDDKTMKCPGCGAVKKKNEEGKEEVK